MALEPKCSTCQAAQLPKLARPVASVTKWTSMIGYMGGLEWTNQQGTRFHIYHVVDRPMFLTNNHPRLLFFFYLTCGSHGPVHQVK